MFRQTRRNFTRTVLGTVAVGSVAGVSTASHRSEAGTTLSINGRDFPGDEVTYFFRVDGDVEKVDAGEASINEGDHVHGTFVHGWVAGGVDAYRITGTLTDFEFVARSCPVHLGEDRINPDDYGSLGFSALTVSGEGLEGPAPYRFEVTDGRLSVSSENYATLDSTERIDGTVGEGVVDVGGVDSFEFTGELISFEFTGEREAEVFLENERIDPADY